MSLWPHSDLLTTPTPAPVPVQSPEVPVDPGRVSLLPGPPPLGPATCPELRAPRLCSLWPSVVSSTSAVSE